jgi:hypothetical protein
MKFQGKPTGLDAFWVYPNSRWWLGAETRLPVHSRVAIDQSGQGIPLGVEMITEPL